jgi:hypothetical protein
MSDWINHGISIGSVEGDVAIGDHNTLGGSVRNEPLARSLAELASAIEAFQGAPETRQALLSAHAEISQELDAPAPDKQKLLGKLMALSAVAGSASGVIGAATALAQVVMTAVH